MVVPAVRRHSRAAAGQAGIGADGRGDYQAGMKTDGEGSQGRGPRGRPAAAARPRWRAGARRRRAAAGRPGVSRWPRLSRPNSCAFSSSSSALSGGTHAGRGAGPRGRRKCSRRRPRRNSAAAEVESAMPSSRLHTSKYGQARQQVLGRGTAARHRRRHGHSTAHGQKCHHVEGLMIKGGHVVTFDPWTWATPAVDVIRPPPPPPPPTPPPLADGLINAVGPD